MTKSKQVDASDGTVRYSYAELKEAQRQCTEKAVGAALAECATASTAQQEVFQAHVSDLCASVFLSVVRRYNPETREDLEPVDETLVAKLADMEKALQEKEASVKKLREQVPELVAQKTRQQLDNLRKRNANVLVNASEVATLESNLSAAELDTMKEAHEKTASAIASANAKLSHFMSQTTASIHVLEQAMKRPKTAVDLAMEQSPLKTRVVLNEQEQSHEEESAPLRSRLALQLTASKDV